MRKLIDGNAAAWLCRFLLVAATLATPGIQARAEVSPDVYRDLQRKAPEFLTIAVQSVQTRSTRHAGGQWIHVTVVARVRQVQRSRSKLKPGQLIHIRYTHDSYDEPISGPSPVPILRKGQTYPAFLRPGGKGTGKDAKRVYYAPAAGGYSFEIVGPPR